MATESECAFVMWIRTTIPGGIYLATQYETR